MSDLPLHPAIVHVPLGLAVAVPFVLAWLGASVVRGVLPAKAVWTAVLLQAILVLGGVAALATGDEEAERVHSVVPHDAIEEHEHDAQLFVFLSGLSLAASIAAAVARTDAQRKGGLVVAFFLSAFGLAMGLDAGHHGGELVFEHGAANVPLEGSGGSSDAHDDDH